MWLNTKKKLGAEVFGELRNMVSEEIKWSDKVTNVEVLDRIGQKRTPLNNILRGKANWLGDILRRNSFFMKPLKDR